MKMLSHTSLVLLSAVTICVCGPQHSVHLATAAPAFEVFSKSTSTDDDVSAEVIAATGLGGMDGAVVLDLTGEWAALATNPHETALSRSDVQRKQPGS